MNLDVAIQHKKVAHTEIAGERYKVTRGVIAHKDGYNGKVNGYQLYRGLVPYGTYTNTSDIEEAVQDRRGPYSQWKYADWR